MAGQNASKLELVTKTLSEPRKCLSLCLLRAIASIPVTCVSISLIPFSFFFFLQHSNMLYCLFKIFIVSLLQDICFTKVEIFALFTDVSQAARAVIGTEQVLCTYVLFILFLQIHYFLVIFCLQMLNMAAKFPTLSYQLLSEFISLQFQIIEQEF